MGIPNRNGGTTCALLVRSMGNRMRKGLTAVVGDQVLAEREGFESARKRKFNNMQDHGWHRST